MTRFISPCSDASSRARPSASNSSKRTTNGAPLGVVEDAAQVARRLPQERGDDGVDADGEERPAELGGQRLGRGGLPAARRTLEQDPLSAGDAGGIELGPASDLGGEGLQEVRDAGGEHQVVEHALGRTDLAERPLALTVRGRLRQDHGRTRVHARPYGQQPLQVTGEGEVLLGLLLRDDLLRGATKGQLVAGPEGPEELLQVPASHLRRVGRGSDGSVCRAASAGPDAASARLRGTPRV